MPRLTTIDRRVNPVQDLSLLGLVSGYVEFGPVILEEDVITVALVEPTYIADLPDEIVVSLQEEIVYAVVEEQSVRATLDSDDVTVETCT
jgi:hypothetical protein